MSEEIKNNPSYITIETGSQKHPEAQNTEDGRVVASVEIFVGKDLEEAVEKYGEEFILESYKRSVIVSVQGKVRRALDQGISVAKVEEEFNHSDPTEKATTVADPQALALRAFNRMSPEEREKFLALLPQ